jgi:hypothetical protein
MAMLAIANQRMHVRIRVAKVDARSVGTGEALRVSAFGGSSSAFHLTPETHRLWCRPST